MAKITPAMIKDLRERTQAGMADCKNALEEAGGDADKAVEIILKKGIVKAAARAGRVATEGEVRTHVSADGKHGVIVEINSQTDFVSRGDDFRGFVSKVTDVASKAAAGADLGAQKYPGTDKTIDDVRKELVAKTGENVVVRRWAKLDAAGPHGLVHSYIHPGGKLGVLIAVEAPNESARKAPAFHTFVDNCAMQIAAMNAMVVRREEVPAPVIDKQKEIFQAQLKEEKKPEQAWAKIIEGKLAKWFTEITLLAQDDVWNQPSKGTIDWHCKEHGKELGGEVKIHAFVRYSLGEGIDKAAGPDLAEEVGKLAGL